MEKYKNIDPEKDKGRDKDMARKDERTLLGVCFVGDKAELFDLCASLFKNTHEPAMKAHLVKRRMMMSMMMMMTKMMTMVTMTMTTHLLNRRIRKSVS